MSIQYSELEDEVRDGFYVDSLMKCYWKSQLRVLEEIDKVCRKHKIQYQAEWGSLLGTVRHEGFIPWDDDMDISMKRQDYKKFLKYAKEELPEGFYIFDYHNSEDYWDVMSRVINLRKANFGHDYLEANGNCPFAAGVDIFPLDFLPVNQEDAEIMKRMIGLVKTIADACSEGIPSEGEFEEGLQALEKLCNLKIKREGNLRENLYDIMVSLYSLYQEEEAEEIAIVPLWVENGGCVYPKEYYSKTVWLPFENIKIPVPIAYDSILKRKYGDYMKMVRKGGGHEYPCYKRQLDFLKKEGMPWPCYEFSKRVCRKEEKEKNCKSDLEGERLEILEKIHLGLYKILLVGELEMSMQLLEKCQECAITMGESISERVKGCDTIIEILEEYCELVYQIYQMIADGEVPDANGVFQILQEQLTKIKEECLKDYEFKKKVVFVTYKASHWKSLESIWKAAKEDENSIVSVLVVPYFYKRADKSFIEEHYEKDLFPEYVEIEDYKTFDLKKYHPDIIYINSPYDEYNYLSNIHPAFYSSKLVDMCEKLVYIPWFVLSEFDREDERGWQSMQHFVTMPGVVNADQVIVQSEKMKQNYVDYLTDWAGEETRSIWEQKISGLGSSLMGMEDDREELEKIIPDRWKRFLYKVNGERKKVILYSMSSASFIDYKEKAVDKLKRVLEIFKENMESICVLWYWDVVMEETLKANYPALWTEFCQIVERYQEEAWGIFETKADRKLMVRFSDAYYGDGCAVSQMMVMAEKPVMLENFEC